MWSHKYRKIIHLVMVTSNELDKYLNAVTCEKCKELGVKKGK